jgi:hypothetical protein
LVCPIFQAHPNYIRFGCMSLLLLLLWSYIYIYPIISPLKSHEVTIVRDFPPLHPYQASSISPLYIHWMAMFLTHK